MRTGAQRMQDDHRNLAGLVGLGLLIALGKLLASDEKLTWRLIVGRSMLGSATSMIAGVALVQIPDIPLVALLGIGSALGMLGAQVIEKWFFNFGPKG